MSVRKLLQILHGVAFVAMLALAGCGGEKITEPKFDLSEQEKKQIQELNEQRQKEWSGTTQPAPQ